MPSFRSSTLLNKNTYTAVVAASIVAAVGVGFITVLAIVFVGVSYQEFGLSPVELDWLGVVSVPGLLAIIFFLAAGSGIIGYSDDNSSYSLTDDDMRFAYPVAALSVWLTYMLVMHFLGIDLLYIGTSKYAVQAVIALTPWWLILVPTVVIAISGGVLALMDAMGVITPIGVCVALLSGLLILGKAGLWLLT